MKNTLFFLFVCSSLFSYSQSLNKTPYYSANGVTINVTSTNCINQKEGTAIQYLYIEINNLTASKIKLSFKKEVWYNNVCQNCNNNDVEFNTTIIIPAKSKVVGNCDDKDTSLRIFSKMLNLDGVRKLTKYELKNIKIESIK